jgi:hypothetical protein
MISMTGAWMTAISSQIPRMSSGQMMYVSQPYENTPGVFNIKLTLPVTTPEGADEARSVPSSIPSISMP